MINEHNVNAMKKCVFIGNKYYFCKGKYSINPKGIGLPLCLMLFIYNFVHICYLVNKYYNNSSHYIYLLIINIILFTLHILQTLNTALTDPGSFLPNYNEDKSNSIDAKLMIATIQHQDYFLKFCRTCLNARDLRVFHCSDCGLCILRHDHHCPWLSTCIGLKNHKHFLFLVIINLAFFLFNCLLLTQFLLLIIKVNVNDLNEITNEMTKDSQ